MLPSLITWNVQFSSMRMIESKTNAENTFFKKKIAEIVPDCPEMITIESIPPRGYLPIIVSAKQTHVQDILCCLPRVSNLHLLVREAKQQNQELKVRTGGVNGSTTIHDFSSKEIKASASANPWILWSDQEETITVINSGQTLIWKTDAFGTASISLDHSTSRWHWGLFYDLKMNISVCLVDVLDGKVHLIRKSVNLKNLTHITVPIPTKQQSNPHFLLCTPQTGKFLLWSPVSQTALSIETMEEISYVLPKEISSTTFVPMTQKTYALTSLHILEMETNRSIPLQETAKSTAAVLATDAPNRILVLNKEGNILQMVVSPFPKPEIAQ